MCSVCGCGGDDAHVEGDAHVHVRPDGTTYRHSHPHHDDDHGHDHAHDHVTPDAGAAPADDADPTRMLRVEQDILAANDALAAANRQRLDDHAILALNLVSSPGSGKTTLLVATIAALKGRVDIRVIEGDQQTALDAERIRATGVPALQINTGRGCHLDARRVGHAIERLAPADASLLLIENVGNLVCPAAFDLGERHKVLVWSVTEGEDKPLKYPDMFRAADLLLLNKCDLLPHLAFDIDQAETHARRVNPGLTMLRVSATTGEGMADWLAWIEDRLAAR